MHRQGLVLHGSELAFVADELFEAWDLLECMHLVAVEVCIGIITNFGNEESTAKIDDFLLAGDSFSNVVR